MKEDIQKIRSVAKEGSEAYFARQMELLKTFSAIDCGTGNIAGNEKVVQIVLTLLKELGATCECIHSPDVGTHVVGRLNAGGKGKIIVNAHLDTVFDLGQTKKHPFRIEGDWAYGLGLADCKGGVVTAIFALKIMQEAGYLPNKEMVMIFNCDEEIGSPTGRAIFREESKGAECAFVFEPARNQNGIITKRRGQALCSIKVTGKEAHAALNPDGGCSATLELAHKVIALEQMKKPKDAIHYVVGRMSGGKTSLAVADRAWAEAAVSLKSEQSILQVEADMEQLEKNVKVDGCSTATNIDVIFPPMERTSGNVALYALAKEAGEMMQLDLPEEFAAGPSDACYFSSFGVPTIDALGPYMKDIHTVQEAMYLPSLRKRTQLFCMILACIMKGEQ